MPTIFLSATKQIYTSGCPSVSFTTISVVYAMRFQSNFSGRSQILGCVVDWQIIGFNPGLESSTESTETPIHCQSAADDPIFRPKLLFFILSRKR